MRTTTYFTLSDQKRSSSQVERKNQNYFKVIYTPFYCFGLNRNGRIKFNKGLNMNLDLNADTLPENQISPNLRFIESNQSIRINEHIAYTIWIS